MDYTIHYYNQNAENFIASTQNVDMHFAQDKFLSLLESAGTILDFGCGSGRDTKYFLEKGYPVTATDGSSELCRLASIFTGIEVKEMLFQDLDEVDIYDGIWACSSILHLSKKELYDVLGKMRNALKNNGVIYTSFKYSEFEGERNGRYFTDFTIDSFEKYIENVEGLSIEEYWLTGDVRPGRGEEKWLNLILRKNEIR
ncbi:MAG: methyltransferase domain-containing protein [Eubacteriales bacterium]|nr:methyltransferase domain-containing protein [Eubacteriales bacterium]